MDVVAPFCDPRTMAGWCAGFLLLYTLPGFLLLGRNLEGQDHLTRFTLATSLGLFGTVLGLARAFFAKGAGLALAAPEVLASGMATALFTTVAGLSIFLIGQASLLVFSWWEDAAVRRLARTSQGGGA